MITPKKIEDIDFNDELYRGCSLASMQLEAPDVHWQWQENHQVTACLSLWWQSSPDYHGGRSGLIGHFNCLTAESGAAILQTAKEFLFQQGIEHVIGPINGSSWFSYRLALDPLPEPAFAREPWQPPHHLEAFQRAGFQIAERYHSARQPDLNFHDHRSDKASERLAKNGVVIRDIAPEYIDDELPVIHQFCLQSFASNPLYKPIDLTTFDALYRETLTRIPPPFGKLAFLEGKLVGLLFTYPDQNRLIVKTSAVKSSRQTAGLSVVLMEQVSRFAKSIGLTEAIFALMHDQNKTRNATTERAQPFRRYVLMKSQKNQ